MLEGLKVVRFRVPIKALVIVRFFFWLPLRVRRLLEGQGWGLRVEGP